MSLVMCSESSVWRPRAAWEIFYVVGTTTTTWLGLRRHNTAWRHIAVQSTSPILDRYKTDPISPISQIEWRRRTALFHGHRTTSIYYFGMQSVARVSNVDCQQDYVTRSSAVAERPRDASCHWIFRKVTQDHSRLFELTPLNKACVSPYQYSIVTMCVVLFLRYSASNDGVSLKSVLAWNQRHWKWYHSKAGVAYGFLLAFHSNYMAVSVAERDGQTDRQRTTA